ncbi:hypothetical protein M9H77_36439 [Catharanthus roseus]|uniref:Uncharacterized protein n=1 Tax=Catharanthus roseus TaxID=4058 RepID=A0ACB9ZRU6_CATRO|nr:hypothetical protein M9H77_36439 [Catharanthus roseus]
MVQAIKYWLISKSAFEERSLNGLTSCYKCFMKELSNLASLLLDVTKKKTQFIWQICLHLIVMASNQVHSTTLYSSCEVDYGFKLLISFALMSLSIDHVLSLYRKKKDKFEGFHGEGQVSKLLIIYTISKDYSREQFGCEKKQVL